MEYNSLQNDFYLPNSKPEINTNNPKSTKWQDSGDDFLSPWFSCKYHSNLQHQRRDNCYGKEERDERFDDGGWKSSSGILSDRIEKVFADSVAGLGTGIGDMKDGPNAKEDEWQKIEDED